MSVPLSLIPCKLCSHILHIQPSSKFSQTSFPSKPPNIKANGWNCSHHLTQLQLVENGGLAGRLGHGPSCRHRRQWQTQCIWGIRSKMVKTPFCTFKNSFKNKKQFFFEWSPPWYICQNMFWRFIWQILWYSTWYLKTFYLAFYLTFGLAYFLMFCLTYFRAFYLASDMLLWCSFRAFGLAYLEFYLTSYLVSGRHATALRPTLDTPWPCDDALRWRAFRRQGIGG